MTVVKRLAAIAGGAGLLLLSQAALAGGHKADLAHCDCNADGSDLEWQILSVSMNARGHRNHGVGDEVTCFDASGAEVGTYERGADDCTLLSSANGILGVLACLEDPEPDTTCSAP